ncbi:MULTISPECIES: flagellar transcriptional regulator FlhC [Halomonas]|uniref:flagellar transcriptional regulator FlhC n=1 Tax=Halomonas TaxID=2745 RepID=UPI001A8DC8F5|nr:MULTISPECIES: flagellar transcriptional regulator FlhC [Halomonas]MED5296144.1 flagellar transcriptional regulator FlhC [Pseudomonadota bacterium]MBN8412629.1 flagellar transcriptional regulator FlhC [Halomonas litopenaei]MBY5924941.1 flagellar transcriptional regulator FlhC [Halomonas sp. DP4Y7-2]MBY5928720.1 flagellar transcriptional regulator FlhC [Halomonas sp. DP8Y7-3]MBY6206195.1 flagellar transcriptional regulator FlhC [Halomonas sp. DP3Y7-2]
MSTKSLVEEMHQVQLAIDLIELGARLQVLETETDLSRARLIRLFKEVRGMSPPKGMLPFSTDWFITWLPNIHSSLFYAYYQRLLEQDCERMEAFVKAYRLYTEQVDIDAAEPVLGLTRAWTLIRFFESDLLQLNTCTRCQGHFVAHAHSPSHDYVCGICQPPSRAGKTRRRQALTQDGVSAEPIARPVKHQA